jgi:hypothetical protein
MPAPVTGLAGDYFFFLGVWARFEAIGPRSLGGVFGFRRSLPACDAVRLEVAMKHLVAYSIPSLHMV